MVEPELHTIWSLCEEEEWDRCEEEWFGMEGKDWFLLLPD